MFLDYAENIAQILANMAALLACLFQYISNRNRRIWFFAGLFYIGSLLSSYYWAAYLLINKDLIDAADALSYMGWNLSFLFLLILVLKTADPEERRFFHPLMLLPLPLLVWQMILYIPFGNVVNSVYQVSILTAAVCFCIRSICWYRRNKAKGARKPYFAVTALIFIFCEFAMWIVTCFDEPVANLYYPFSFLSSASAILMFIGLHKTLKDKPDGSAAAEESASVRDRINEAKVKTNLLVPMIIIFLLMSLMVVYTTETIQNVAVANIYEVGEDKISSIAAEIDNYLEMTKSTLWVTADTVDHMVRNGASVNDIVEYITEESVNQGKHFNEDSTGLYGYVMGEYVDGAGWVPPEDYEPTTRDWYLTAIKANGDTVIVPPYIDMQTGGVIISICRMLSNGSDVLSLDVMMNDIQNTTADLHIKGKGYGFIVNRDGMYIAHPDETLKGSYLTDDIQGRVLLEKIKNSDNNVFEVSYDGQKETVFVREVMDEWFVVILVGNAELYSEVRQQLAFNILACVIIFLLIAFFYLLGHKKEQNYSRMIEEMTAEEQRQAFEAKTLKLEKEAADQANKAKSDFLADMSHEIRTPINAVLGMNEMILREHSHVEDQLAASTGEVAQAFNNISLYAGNIERAGTNLLSLINDILDFSKIEAGKIEISESKYSLSSVLNDVSNMTYFKAREKGLEFTVDVDETLPDMLYGDEVRVHQVILNILNNAVKYTKKGSVLLTVRSGDAAEPVEGGTEELLISVKDTGIGIREEDMGKLFDKFARVDLKQNSTVEGTGLGLAITRSLLDLMGGSITAESVYGEGSTFTIKLPQKVVSCEPVGDFQAKFRQKMLEAQTYKESFRAPGAHILVVDDTPMNITVAVSLLQDTMLKIDTAGGGEEAVKKAGEKAYDLILMDQRMPRMDGTEALRLIRSQAGGPNFNTPVICLTADAVIGARERYIAEGFTDYLTKPIDSADLEKMLIKYLPPEKVKIIKADDAPGEGEAGFAEDLAALRSAGIEPETGLRHCNNDEDLYRSLLSDFASGAEGRLAEIQKFYDAQDWKNYSVLVHALKSSSRMIGAERLAAAAAGLEAAADRNDTVLIRSGHAGMAAQCSKTAAAVSIVCGSGENAPGAEVSTADDEILEFLPE
ncbi:MAG: response regulator [Firmicutes bacterium]|nr:response regulator [Bacillota bacterium]